MQHAIDVLKGEIIYKEQFLNVELYNIAIIEFTKRNIKELEKAIEILEVTLIQNYAKPSN